MLSLIIIIFNFNYINHMHIHLLFLKGHFSEIYWKIKNIFIYLFHIYKTLFSKNLQIVTANNDSRFPTKGKSLVNYETFKWTHGGDLKILKGFCVDAHVVWGFARATFPPSWISHPLEWLNLSIPNIWSVSITVPVTPTFGL